MKYAKNMSAAALAITVATALAGGAHAATLELVDFTDRTVWTGQDGNATSTAPYGGLTVSLSSNPADRLNFTNDFDGTGASEFCNATGGPLACDSDGVGVVDDEVSVQDNNQTPPLQSITVDFSKSVRVTGVHFLDLFFDPNAEDQEMALVYANGDQANVLAFNALDGFQTDGGYRFSNELFGNTAINSLTFYANPSNDGRGVPDYALAGINVAPVPLPAAGLLLLGGLGGLAALRRRKRAA